MIDLLTYATNAILLITLGYCILLERRIRAFRQQESVFRGLISEVTRATASAQTAVSQLRAALNDADQLSADTRAARPRHAPLTAQPRDPISPHRKIDGRSELSDLARRVAEMRMSGAQVR